MGGFGKNKSESKQKPYVPASWIPLQGRSASVLTDLMRGGPEYGGIFSVPMTSAESASLSGITGAAGAGLDYGQDALDATMRGDFLRLDSNPFAQDAIRSAQRPILQAFEEGEILDRFNFANAGHSLPESSPFARARSIATRGLADSLSDVSSDFLNRQFQAERQNQLAATDIARQLQGDQFQRRLEALQAQALPRLIAQYGVDQGLAEFRRRAELMLASAQVAGGLAAPIVLGSSKSSGWNFNIDAPNISMTG
jgi:hypothetical protein